MDQCHHKGLYKREIGESRSEKEMRQAERKKGEVGRAEGEWEMEERFEEATLLASKTKRPCGLKKPEKVRNGFSPGISRRNAVLLAP